MIRPVIFYQAVCDRCGYVDKESDYAAWGEPAQALDVAVDSEWVALDARGEDAATYPAATLLCADCWTWADDDEHKIAKPPITEAGQHADGTPCHCDYHETIGLRQADTIPVPADLLRAIEKARRGERWLQLNDLLRTLPDPDPR